MKQSTLSLAFSMALSAAALLSPASRAADLAGIDRESGCRFELPAAWDYNVLKWSGACAPDKTAQGPGVLRAYEGGKVTSSYFGQLDRGHLAMGVIETEGGYIAGKFVNGKPSADQDRNDLIKAFDTAATAADMASEGYKRAGNAASASFYAQKAKRLRAQMD